MIQLGNFIDVFLARHVSGTYAHHQEHYMSSCSIWFSAPSFWMGGGLENRCVGRVYGAEEEEEDDDDDDVDLLASEGETLLIGVG